MFGLTFEKLLIVGLLAAFLVGPERLPQLAESVSRMLRELARLTRTSKERLEAEFGEDLDWKTLDPRQYDPRRIIRDSLGDLLDPPLGGGGPSPGETPADPGAAPTRRDGRGLRTPSASEAEHRPESPL